MNARFRQPPTSQRLDLLRISEVSRADPGHDARSRPESSQAGTALTDPLSGTCTQNPVRRGIGSLALRWHPPIVAMPMITANGVGDDVLLDPGDDRSVRGMNGERSQFADGRFVRCRRVAV